MQIDATRLDGIRFIAPVRHRDQRGSFSESRRRRDRPLAGFAQGPVTLRPGHDAGDAIDPGRIAAEPGWRRAVTLAAGLHRTVQWHLDNEPRWRALQGRTRA